MGNFVFDYECEREGIESIQSERELELVDNQDQ